MTLLDNLRKVYHVQVRCKNCFEITEASVPKGVLVKDYLESRGACSNCGTISLERYDGGKFKDKDNNDSNIFDKGHGTFQKNK